MMSTTAAAPKQQQQQQEEEEETQKQQQQQQPSSREPTPSEEDVKSPSPSPESDPNKESPVVAPEPEKTMPQFSYSKVELMEIAGKPLAKRRPKCLDPAYDNAFGLWDPEKWFLGKRRAESPLQDDLKAKREKPSETERDSLYYKRRLSDPKERIKEEQDIILSPQRRSFGTGCHVTLQSRRPESPCDLRSNDREPFRDPGRRIGSGRIISRDRDSRQDRDFGFRTGDRRDRFDRDDREMRFGGRSNRDFPERRGRGRQQRIEEEEEPEWFSGGPTSQLETIELHGFEDADRYDPRDEMDGRGSKRWRRGSSRKNKSIIEEKDILEEDEKEEEPAPSSGKGNAGQQQDKLSSTDAVSSAEFDMSKIFELDSLPSFLPNGTTPDSRRGSRFSQWFRSESPTILHDELNAAARNNDINFDRTSPANTQDQSKSILVDLLCKSSGQISDAKGDGCKNNKLQELVLSGQAHKVHEIEAELKQLVLGNRPLETPNIEVPSTPSPRANEEDLTAFKKLLAQINEGHAQPVQQGTGAFEALDKNRIFQEKDVVQMSQLQETNELASPSMGNMMGKNAAQMKILKDAPTEQDILAGNIKGQIPVHPPQAAPTSSPAGASTYPDFLMRFLQQPSIVAPMPQQTSSQDDVLCKLLMSNPNLRPTSPAFQELLGGQLKRPNIGAAGNQPLRPQIGVSPAISNKLQRQHQREILASIVKQQKQQQQQLQQAAATAVQLQQPPSLLTQAPNPSPPAPHLNRVLSPNSQPSHVADAMTAQPMFQSTSTRIPSPLIFGQTPPLLSHAPSPIHPGQVGASMGNTLNPNSLQVYNPQVAQRVPSPQELILHTQQIMQNALIKSKLEEQEKNFRKRQEMQRTRSPNVQNIKVSTESSPTKMVGLSTTMAAFTPTSVMRKMHAEKDKEGGSKLDSSLQHSFSGRTTDPKFVVQPMQQSLKTPLSTVGGGNTGIDAGDKMPRPLHGQGIMHSQVPPRNASISCGGQMGRPIVKGNQGVVGIATMASNKNAGVPNPKMNTSAVPMNLVQNKSTGPGMNGNFDMNKLIEHQCLVQRQLNASPMPSSSMPHSTYPARGGAAGIHPSMRNTSMNFPPTNMMLRNVHPSVNQAAVLRARLNHLALQQVIDSQRINMSHQTNPLQSIRLGPSSASCLQPQNVAPNVQGPMVGMTGAKPEGQSLSSLSANCSLNNNMTSGHNSGGTATLSSSCHSPVNNLSKWFNSEVLKQKLPDLPPVPKQKALSLEEVERLQQTAVHN